MNQLLPPRLFLGCLVLSITLGIAVPVAGPAPGAIRAAAALPIALGVWLVLANARRFSRVGANIVTTGDPTRLLRDGAYAWTRNPMYLGFLLTSAGLAGAVGTLAALTGPLVFFVVADRWYIPFEERRMVAVFAADYHEYRSRVGRWIGRRSAVSR